MQPNKQPLEFWSDGLALALLESISNAGLVKLATKENVQLDDPRSLAPAACLHRESQTRRELQLAIMGAWRKSNSEVVAATEMVSIDGSAEQCEAMLRQFRGEEVLLELITGNPDDGWELAAWVVDNIKNPTVRHDLASILAGWSADALDFRGQRGAMAERAVRVVIFGGHVRDPNKMTERLFQGSAFETRWKPFEKGAAVPSVKTISEAMASADAVLLVTTMVSHNIMQIVKRVAREKQIPFRAIHKATDLHLIAALGELFPGVAAARV